MSDELRPEYDLDYRRAKLNRFASGSDMFRNRRTKEGSA